MAEPARAAGCRRREAVPAAAAALLLAWLVVRSAATGLAAAGGSVALARVLAPGSAAVLVAMAGDIGPGAAPFAAREAMLARAAARAPLAYEPFLARALADAAAGRWERAIRAGEAARAREPRSPAVRGVLLRAYLHRARWAAAVGELDAIVARNGTADDRALALFASLADLPGGAAAVAAALAARPRWRPAFVGYAAARGLATPLLFRVLRRGGSAEERGAFLRALAGAGDPARAYLAWIGFLTPAQVAAAKPIYDGGFREPGAPAPFNWSLRQDALAFAERTRDTRLPAGTALDVRFRGAQAAEIADETLMLSPGRYAFAAMASGVASGPFAGTLRWDVVCRPSGTVLPLVALAALPARATLLSAEMTVPGAGCDSQELVLGGEPGEVATETRAQFTGLRLDRR